MLGPPIQCATSTARTEPELAQGRRRRHAVAAVVEEQRVARRLAPHLGARAVQRVGRWVDALREAHGARALQRCVAGLEVAPNRRCRLTAVSAAAAKLDAAEVAALARLQRARESSVRRFYLRVEADRQHAAMRARRTHAPLSRGRARRGCCARLRLPCTTVASGGEK
eukprot:1826905-Pleurochrysis_carterae.AAC.2